MSYLGLLSLLWLFPAFFSFQVGMHRNCLSRYGVGGYLAAVWCSFKGPKSTCFFASVVVVVAYSFRGCFWLLFVYGWPCFWFPFHMFWLFCFVQFNSYVVKN
jgi:hypothetical protein